MPNPSTPETPGSTTDVPILGTYQAWFLRGMTNTISLVPGGMLYAVRITGNHNDIVFRNAAITFRLTNYEKTVRHAEVFKPSYWDAPYLMEDILIILAKPLPDLNSAHPYQLSWKADAEIGIRSVTSYHKWF